MVRTPVAIVAGVTAPRRRLVDPSSAAPVAVRPVTVRPLVPRLATWALSALLRKTRLPDSHTDLIRFSAICAYSCFCEVRFLWPMAVQGPAVARRRRETER